MQCSESLCRLAWCSWFLNFEAFKLCFYFNDAISSSIVLQYIIKLDTFGYEDGPGPAVGTSIPATRLSQLQMHIDAWDALDWVESRMAFSIQRFGPSVLCGGIYAFVYGGEVT